MKQKMCLYFSVVQKAWEFKWKKVLKGSNSCGGK